MSAMRALRFLILAGLCSACARGPNVGSDQLPLKRVVIYRNGVGYFERAGKVDDERVAFEMRQKMVGDFLASLAIIERGGSSVRSASFPLAIEDTETPTPPDKPIPRGGRGSPERVRANPDAMREVVLHLDGREHDLMIGYLAETPVWRPSYRVVVHEDGTADLQAWGIIQNLSGEDWQGVQLSLVAGAPIAFQSTLGNPVVPTRPIVSDEGEIIAAVPTGVTSLDKSRQDDAVDRVGPEQEREQSAAPPPPPSLADEEALEKGAGGGQKRSRGLGGLGGGATGSAANAPGERPRPSRPASAPQAADAEGYMDGNAASPAKARPKPDLSPPRKFTDLAAVALEAGATRYDIPHPVTVPNESATMVLLASQKVPGQSVFLFAPDPGVPASASHPFRVARFTNATAGLLERGPIAVFEKGSFLGQGLLDPLPARATATVPFAVDRSIAVSTDRRYDQQGARLYRIEASSLLIERDEVTRTIYRIDNGGTKTAKLLVKHARIGGTRLHRPPAGTEDNPAAFNALVPVELRQHGKLELTVEERRATQQPADWLSDLADEAVRAYLADARANPELARRLRDAWAIREVLKRAGDEQQKLYTEQRELESSAQETRLSLRSIEKNNQAGDLRAKLTKRLGEIMARLDQITKRLIEVQLVMNEQHVRFRDAIREIRLPAPLPPKP
jgi:hypothetical protein